MIFFHGTTREKWETIKKEGVLHGDGHKVTYLATDYDEACCYGNIVLAVNYDPFKEGAMNNYRDGCWQVRVYDPIPIESVKEVRMERYIRFGNIPEDERSSVWAGEVEVGKEEGVSVYRATKVDRKWTILFPTPLKESKLFSLQALFYGLCNCGTRAYLVGGDEVGTGKDGEPLLRNVEVFADITDQLLGKKEEDEK